MIRSSLRVWLFVVSVLFAVAVVGGIAVTTYVIVADGMQTVTDETTQRIAASASTLLRDAFTEADVVAGSQGFVGQSRAALVLESVRVRLPSLLNRPGIGEAEYALYAANGALLWSSSAKGVWEDQRADRTLASRDTKTTVTTTHSGDFMSGLLDRARLPQRVSHVPVPLPNGTTGVLDVTYPPATEERVMDEVRAPMAGLAISAMIIMVLLMQSSVNWVLSLVDTLRRAADSIDAGQLDSRLPDGGTSEISALAKSINRLIERLQRRSDAQARFVADASHELATPVAGIRGYTSILRAWGAEDPIVRDEAIDAIDRESRRMARLSGDLLNLLQADQGLVLKTERFDVNALVRDRIAATASRWMEKEIDYVGPEDEDPLVMMGDPDRLEDVVSILLDNASKYTPAGGKVVVSTRRKRDMVVVEVADTGQGIPAEEISRIFDRFFRSEASRAAGDGGFGLGLSIAKSIVDSMGGQIRVESAVGSGTTFIVRAPRGRV